MNRRNMVHDMHKYCMRMPNMDMVPHNSLARLKMNRPWPMDKHQQNKFQAVAEAMVMVLVQPKQMPTYKQAKSVKIV